MNDQIRWMPRQLRGPSIGKAMLALLLASVVGCGGYQRPIGIPVTGTVTLDGKPIKLGSIVFSPQAAKGAAVTISGGDSATATIQDGRFAFSELDGPPTGTSDVHVIVQNEVSVALDDEQAFSQALVQGKVSSPVNTKVQFQDPKAKTVEIKEGSLPLTIQLITTATGSSPAVQTDVENP